LDPLIFLLSFVRISQTIIVFVERLWRTVKQEEVYLKGYRNIPECREGLSHYFDRYNNLREHQSLGYNYPAEIYCGEIELKKAA